MVFPKLKTDNRRPEFDDFVLAHWSVSELDWKRDGCWFCGIGWIMWEGVWENVCARYMESSWQRRFEWSMYSIQNVMPWKVCNPEFLRRAGLATGKRGGWGGQVRHLGLGLNSRSSLVGRVDSDELLERSKLAFEMVFGVSSLFHGEIEVNVQGDLCARSWLRATIVKAQKRVGRLEILWFGDSDAACVKLHVLRTWSWHR